MVAEQLVTFVPLLNPLHAHVNVEAPVVIPVTLPAEQASVPDGAMVWLVAPFLEPHAPSTFLGTEHWPEAAPPLIPEQVHVKLPCATTPGSVTLPLMLPVVQACVPDGAVVTGVVLVAHTPVTGCGPKFALTVFGPLMFTAHTVALPVQSPLQPAKA